MLSKQWMSCALVGVVLAGGCTPTQTRERSERGAERVVQPATNRGFRALDEREFAVLRKSVLLTDADVAALRQSRPVLEAHVDELLGVWYGFVGANEHLVSSFADPATGQPNAEYLEKVRLRFRAWVLETAEANFDQAWLNRQLEYGLRHHRLKKNVTDGVKAAEHIALRHVIALQYPVTATMKPFLERGGHSASEVEAMHEAWRKAVLLTVILWSQPYVAPEDF